MKRLPSSEAMESALCGACILDPTRLDELSHVLPEHFFSECHALVWRTLHQLRSERRGIDETLLTEEIGRKGWLPIPEQGAVSTTRFIVELMGAVANAYHADYYANEVLKAAKRRTVINAGQLVMTAGYDLGRDVDEAVRDAENTLHGVMRIGQKTGPQSIHELLVSISDAIGQNRPRGILTDWPSLDEKFLGWCPGQLIILAARPAMGKTAFALQVAQRVAEVHHSVLFISLEMQAIELSERILARNAGVPEFTLRKGLTTEQQRKAMVDAAIIISNLPVFIDDHSRYLRDVLSAIRLAKRRHGIAIVIVDYLQLVDNSRTSNREQQIAEISRALKAAAKENEVCVIALSQLNRSVEIREDKRPRLSDLRESGSIEQDADAVMFLHRPCVFDAQLDPRECQVILAKQRAGPTGTIRLDFNGEYGSFSDPRREINPDDYNNFD